MYVLENPILNIVFKDVEEKVKNEHECHVDDDEQIVYVVLASMSIWEYRCLYYDYAS